MFELTSNGEQPVARASITLDFTGGDGWAPSATTITDAAGRYLLCNVVDANRLGIAALVRKAGYGDVFVQVPVHSGGSFDMELQRFEHSMPAWIQVRTWLEDVRRFASAA